MFINLQGFLYAKSKLKKREATSVQTEREIVQPGYETPEKITNSIRRSKFINFCVTVSDILTINCK